MPEPRAKWRGNRRVVHRLCHARDGLRTQRPAFRDQPQAPEIERPMPMAPAITSETTAGGVRVALTGGWTINAGSQLEKRASALTALAAGARDATIDLSRIDQMDTAGAWVIDRSRQSLAARGVDADDRRRAARARDLASRGALSRRSKAPPPRDVPTLSSLARRRRRKRLRRGRGSRLAAWDFSADGQRRGDRRRSTPALALDVDGLPSRGFRAAQRADHRVDQFPRRRHRRPAGHLSAGAFRRHRPITVDLVGILVAARARRAARPRS